MTVNLVGQTMKTEGVNYRGLNRKSHCFAGQVMSEDVNAMPPEAHEVCESSLALPLTDVSNSSVAHICVHVVAQMLSDRSRDFVELHWNEAA